MVTAAVVVMISVGSGVIAFVPDVRKLIHGLGFSLIELFEEIGVNRPAIIFSSARVNVDSASNLLLVSGHDVRKVREGFCGVVAKPDMDMNSATP